MSHLFDKHIVEAFKTTLQTATDRALERSVANVLATPGLDKILDLTIERSVGEFAQAELGVPPLLRFPDEFAFFEGYLRLAYESGGASQARGWCSRWWEHRSARFRIRSMWQAYETLAGKDLATCDEVFLRTVGDYHMTLLMGEKSPMYACQSNHQPSKPLKSDPIETNLQ